jgi:hypothetical protein
MAMKMTKMSPFVVVVLSFILISFAGLVLVPFFPEVMEKFGAQGGEMVQLASSRVPTAEDAEDMEEEQKQIAREVYNMTGSPL